MTDSARDAVLWASELASSGNFRRALEIPHAVLTTAFAQQDATLRAERDEWRQRYMDEALAHDSADDAQV